MVFSWCCCGTRHGDTVALAPSVVPHVAQVPVVQRSSVAVPTVPGQELNTEASGSERYEECRSNNVFPPHMNER